MKENKAMVKIYPDSHVEVQGFSARYYDLTLNIVTAGIYDKFIKSVIVAMNIQADEHIMDLGCGTGRNACLMHEYLGEKGQIIGMDISEEMGNQFKRKCAEENVKMKDVIPALVRYYISNGIKAKNTIEIIPPKYKNEN